MTMSAKYSGKCSKCGQVISIGDKIEWVSGKGAKHIECPEKKQNAPVVVQEGQYSIHGGSGYGCQGWNRGQVLKNKKQGEPQYLFVLSSKSRYVSDDGMSFGVGDDRGYTYTANCREATAEEAAPLLEKEAEKAAKKAVETRRTEVAELICKTGEKPDGDNTPEGDRFSGRQDIYGGGDWFVVGLEHIWYCRNNGGDGDNWSCNNVRTGGAGAIGWRIPFDTVLAEEIKKF